MCSGFGNCRGRRQFLKAEAAIGPTGEIARKHGNRRAGGGAALCAALILSAFSLRAQEPAADSAPPAPAAPNPFLGSWKEVKAPAGVTRIRIYQDKGDGLMLHTILEIMPSGSDFTFAAVHYDGKEYPVFDSKTLGAFLDAEVKPTRTAAYFRRNARTLEWTERIDGKLSRTAVFAVSEDGKTLTETVKEFDQSGKLTGMPVFVYDRQ